MKVRLLTVSQRQPRWVTDACEEYGRRLPRAWGFELREIKPQTRGSMPAERVQAVEAERLRAAVPDHAVVVALDQRGESWTTERFAEQLERWQHTGRNLALLIGGADGLDPALQREADVRLSLSRMVMPHGLVRVVVVEQLYRASTVLDGHPYHK